MSNTTHNTPQRERSRDVNDRAAMLEGLQEERAEATKQLGEIIVSITSLHRFTANNAGWVYALKDAALNCEDELLAGLDRLILDLEHEVEDDERQYRAENGPVQHTSFGGC